MAGYANPSPTYQPAMRLVTAITNAENALITTSFAHEYLSGLIVRILVPLRRFGMTQIDKQLGIITVTSTTEFTIDIDTRLYDTFVIPDPEEPATNKFPSCIPVGEINSQLFQATRNVL